MRECCLHELPAQTLLPHVSTDSYSQQHQLAHLHQQQQQQRVGIAGHEQHTWQAAVTTYTSDSVCLYVGVARTRMLWLDALLAGRQACTSTHPRVGCCCLPKVQGWTGQQL